MRHSYGRWAAGVLAAVCVLLAAAAAFVWAADPCFYVRLPKGGRGVFFNERYQNAGLLRHARAEADVVIDTSLSSVKKLRELILKKFSTTNRNMAVTVMSYGFKYGAQNDIDFLFDVRCLPNPYYIEELRPLTGLDEKVYSYVFQWEESREMLRLLTELITFALPLYSNEGRSNLTIAFGCTGGQHRSVSFAQAVGKIVEDLGYNVSIIHRDIDK